MYFGVILYKMISFDYTGMYFFLTKRFLFLYLCIKNNMFKIVRPKLLMQRILCLSQRVKAEQMRMFYMMGN